MPFSTRTRFDVEGVALAARSEWDEAHERDVKISIALLQALPGK